VDKVRVLIVDDSAVMRKIIASALQKEPSIEMLVLLLMDFKLLRQCRPAILMW
jgi:chemotaxis response regulator CheB